MTDLVQRIEEFENWRSVVDKWRNSDFVKKNEQLFSDLGNLQVALYDWGVEARLSQKRVGYIDNNYIDTLLAALQAETAKREAAERERDEWRTAAHLSANEAYNNADQAVRERAETAEAQLVETRRALTKAEGALVDTLSIVRAALAWAESEQKG